MVRGGGVVLQNQQNHSFVGSPPCVCLWAGEHLSGPNWACRCLSGLNPECSSSVFFLFPVWNSCFQKCRSSMQPSCRDASGQLRRLSVPRLCSTLNGPGREYPNRTSGFMVSVHLAEPRRLEGPKIPDSTGPAVRISAGLAAQF